MSRRRRIVEWSAVVAVAVVVGGMVGTAIGIASLSAGDGPEFPY